MPAKTPLLVCLVGPTAIGKTTMAIAIARAFSSAIISADSRQFFKEMTIGTAVPSVDELASVPHYFIQNKSIFEAYNVGDFEREALDTLSQLFKEHSVLVMAGGSGLYVDAVVKGLDNFPEVPVEIRDQLNKEFKEEGISALQTALKKADPLYYEQADIHNQHRVIRALEIYRASGKPFSSFLRKEQPERPFNTLYVGLSAERSIIYDRINMRVDEMIHAGLIEEAKALYEYKELNALQTVGYRELFLYFDGKISKETAIEEIKKNTRRFAKRQGTWFRKNENIHWFEHTVDPKEIIHFIKEKGTL